MPLDPRLLAHQGGWDEILFVLAPLLVFAGLLALARRRADQLGAPDADGAGDAVRADEASGELAADPQTEGTGQA